MPSLRGWLYNKKKCGVFPSYPKEMLRESQRCRQHKTLQAVVLQLQCYSRLHVNETVRFLLRISVEHFPYITCEDNTSIFMQR